MLRIVSSFILLLSICFPSFAQTVEPIDEFSKGSWRYSAFPREGNFSCVIATFFENGRGVLIRKEPSHDYIQFELTSTVWKLRPDASVPIKVIMDNEVWNGITKSFIYDMGQSGLVLDIGADKMKAFLIDLKKSREFAVVFPDNKEAAWVGNLNGSAAVMAKFVSCLVAQIEVLQQNEERIDPFGTNDTDPQPKPEPAPSMDDTPSVKRIPV